MNEPKTFEDLNPIDIYNYAVSFYGGPGFSNNVRTSITLHDIKGNPAGLINFFDDVSKLEKDSIKNVFLVMNLPMNTYQAKLFTLRSNRRVRIAFFNEAVVLVEFAEPKFIPNPVPVDKNKVN